MMRQIQDVLTTQDGQHALALCTDGGVLYYRHSEIPSSPLSSSSSSSSSSTSSNNGKEGENESIEESKFISTGTLIEFQTLTREVEIGPKHMTDGAWCLKRVGCKGAVVLIRSYRNIAKRAPNRDDDDDDDDEDSQRGSMIDISLLSGNFIFFSYLLCKFEISFLI